ncbi:signal transduction protein [Levilactobacillus senmaizukei DSM 21775 = NBRC 103853]|uniref:Signal transduction protein n=1 Tax=Levilactobacillus senmaizukei DSM 21775 = NBRC 103853 TaxID=1423803 RepID=A0A0R2DD35_9LACO|nr:hypothetical protein [Levilactobacillus senmaizukei]KRN01806.1 signal transduction protein [Levilactobacillus senmaizukei DSM 21775 = NBRC 103853]
MITVSPISFYISDFFLVFWFVYFQYYWFPQIRPQKHFLLYCALLAGIFTFVDIVNPFTKSAVLGAFSIIVLLGIELGWLGGHHRWQYIPSFIDVSILAYLLTEFIDMVILAGMIHLTGPVFAASLTGTIIEMILDTAVFSLLAVGIWLTRAPMENLIQDILGSSMEFLFLGFMSILAVVYILFEYSLQSLANSEQYLFFLAGIAGILLIGLSLSTYMLMQTHLQQEHTLLQGQQQAFREQYTNELNRQVQAIRKFNHDYQNMLLGLGGYLEDEDYAGFRQLYIDIRSGWTTSNAAELTLEDLANIPGTRLKFQLYHNYLLAREQGVQLFIQVPEPLTATVAALKQISQVVDQVLPGMVPALSKMDPAVVTLSLKESAKQIQLQLTFSVSKDAKIDGHHRVVTDVGVMSFANVRASLPQSATSSLQLKLHWGQLLVAIPKGVG